MPAAYVLVRSEDLCVNAPLAEYIQRVDATLDQHDATILVQAFPAEVPEGAWQGFITLLQFPSLERAQEWYHSAEYQEIRPLRASSSTPTAVLVEGVPEGHRSANLLNLLGRPSDDA